jgi:NADP-dependent 3-hydroxy acid dehydrogenase YdfG
MSSNTDSRTAVITGAASGIGLETARALAAKGWRLTLADIDQQRLDEIANELAGVTEVLAIQVDVSNAAEVATLAEAAFDRFGVVDFLHSNAGVALLSPLATTGVDDWKWLLDVNVWGTIHCVGAFVPKLVAQERPSQITFTASIAGLVAAPGLGAYGATKYAVVGIAEVLHRELRRDGISVSVLCPMRVATNFARSERNRQPKFGPPSASHEVRKENFGGRSFVGDVMAPAVVANLVVDAIGTDRLYILTHEESGPFVKQKFEQIEESLTFLNNSGLLNESGEVARRG